MRKKDFLKKQEEEKKRKEEEERIKKEEEAKKAAAKAEEKKEKKEEKKDDKAKDEKKEGIEPGSKKLGSICPKIECTCLDLMLKPIEDSMDKVLGTSIDPFTGYKHSINKVL